MRATILTAALALFTCSAAVAEDARIAAMRADKLGMFIHWGVYSIPAKGEWLMYREQIPAAEYDKLADKFRQPDSFSPREWVKLAKRMGAKYAVLTTRHHDGFALFDTKTTDFNSVKTAAKRDYVREFAEACRAEGIRVGFYYSIMNWQFNHSPNGVFDRKVWDAQVACTHEALRELMTNYGKVDYLWYDGCSAPGSTDSETMERMWRIRDLNAMVRRLQPGILINDRSATRQDYATPEQCLTPPPRGRMWESCITCNGMWGYKADDHNWKSADTLFRSLLHCARFGGNLLINIGPRPDGSVPEACVKALEGLGERIAKCPEAIYGAARDDWTEATHEAGVVTKANGSYWLWALNSDRLDGAEKMEKVADGVYKVTFKDGAKPCNWLGGRHDVAITAGSAPILGDDTGREAPPSGTVEPLDLPDATEVAFDLPVGGSWRLDVGYVNADGFKDTFTKTVSTEAGGRVTVAIPSGKGVYARRQTPVWIPVAPRTWQVAGTFKDRYYESRFDESAVKEAFAKDLLGEAAAAKFVPVPEDNDKADKSDVRLNHNYSDPVKEIGYAFAKRIVKSATDRTVYAAVGMDWWSKVYVNGELAHDYASGWKPKPFPLKLKKGDNEILVITHGGCRQHWFTFFMNARETRSEAKGMRYLYSEGETITSPHPCEVTAHPYLADGRPVATAKAGEPFGPLAAGSYLIRETLAPGKVRTRYLAVAKPGWTVVQLTCGTTGDKLDSVVHARRIPMNYYVGVNEAQVDTTFLGWQRDYGDEILLHLHPDSLGKIDPKFKTLKENWEAFTVPEIVERLKALDAWMQDFGFEPLRGFASYTPANTLVAAMREVGWDILHSIIPEQNWSDGHWAINHWGMPNQPFYIASDDFRKSVARGTAGEDVLGMGMNSYHLYMPHVVMWGDNVCSPSHFMRWHRTTDSGDEPVRYENFYEDYLTVAGGCKDSPYFLTTGYEFGRTFGTRSMTVHNRNGCEYAIDRAKNGAKIVFATASDVADWFKRFRPAPAENVFTQRDYLAGTRIMDKPIDSGPSVGMEMRDYKACFAHLEPLPFYHYDYTIPWHFKAADVTAPADFARDDGGRVEVENRGECEVRISVAKALPRVTPVCLWDRELVVKPEGARVFVPPALDDGRRHTVVELPKGFSGKLVLKCRVTGGPDKAEFGGLVTPLWRVQTIGAGARRHCYAFVDTPLLTPCTVRFTCPKDCRIDALERPLGAFKKGDAVELEFTTRRTWYRFWGLSAEEIQPDAAGVAALERAAAEWKSFSDNASVNLAKTHAEDDAFFKSVVPKGEKLLLDVDCFGNAVFGERSRARPFDRCVFAANDKVTAKEYSDGGISYGKGRSFWVHPRGLTLQVEGLDTLGLKPTDTVRIRLSTVAEADEPLSYLITAKSGWNKILGSFVSPADLGNAASIPGEKIVWNPPKERTADGLMVLDVPVSRIQDGTVSIGLRTNQKQILDDWFADGGFIARLERIVVTVLH